MLLMKESNMNRSEQISSAINELISSLGSKVKIIAVSKRFPIEDILFAYEAGQKDFGENRVDELVEKSKMAPQDIKWHFIGHLQSNKVNHLCEVKNLVSIHSIDSLKLLKKVLAKEKNLDLYFQLNMSAEIEKNGCSPEELKEMIDYFNENNKTYTLRGLMCMSGIRGENFEKEAKESFLRLKSIADNYNLETSMGMTNDYQIAIECGSDVIRIGSKIFGPRTH